METAASVGGKNIAQSLVRKVVGGKALFSAAWLRGFWMKHLTVLIRKLWRTVHIETGFKFEIQRGFMMNKPLFIEEICRCPVCNSKRVTLQTQAVLHKYEDANTGKEIDFKTGRQRKLSNREKAREYDLASEEGVGCHMYSCRKCGWESEIFTE